MSPLIGIKPPRSPLCDSNGGKSRTKQIKSFCLNPLTSCRDTLRYYNSNTNTNMNDYKKLEWIHHAIQEAMEGIDEDVMNCNLDELTQALTLVEELRESYLQEKENTA